MKWSKIYNDKIAEGTMDKTGPEDYFYFSVKDDYYSLKFAGINATDGRFARFFHASGSTHYIDDGYSNIFVKGDYIWITTREYYSNKGSICGYEIGSSHFKCIYYRGFHDANSMSPVSTSDVIFSQQEPDSPYHLIIRRVDMDDTSNAKVWGKDYEMIQWSMQPVRNITKCDIQF
jgi:hypothetical protein